MKIRKSLLLVMLLAAALFLAGCAPAPDGQFQMVFGKSASELIPSVGNAAYISRSLVEEAADPDPAQSADSAAPGTSAAASPAEDNYVDPTAGLDCSE